MKVAAVQFKARRGDKVGSLATLAALADRAAIDAELVVLPEMAAVGYVFADRAAVDVVAEPARGDTFAALAPIARARSAWIVAGFAERAADRRFNSALVIDPAGELRFTYRKTLLYELDEAWCDPGDSGYPLLEADGGRFTVGICMDLNDPDFCGWCRAAAPRAIAFPTNWIDQGYRIWGYWAWRLAGTPTALVAANTWGTEAATTFRGESAVVDLADPTRPAVASDRASVLAAAPREGDGVITATLP